MKAELENAEKIGVGEGHAYAVRIKCSHCGEVPENLSFLDESEEVDVPGGRGKAHLVQKCKFCGRMINIKIVSGSAKAYAECVVRRAA